MSAVVIPGGSAYAWEPPERERWMDLAACAQTDPEMFFPEKGGTARDAKKVCRGCPVAGECLAYALRRDERWGIWGGLSERERRRLTPRDARVQLELIEERKQQVERLHALRQTDVEIAAAIDSKPEIVGRVPRSLNLAKNSSGGVPVREGAGPVRSTAPKEERVMTVQQDRDVVGKRPGGRKPSPHGTDKRWKNGPCRDESTCPRGVDGKTCTAAHEEALAAARKGGTPVDASVAVPTAQTGAEGRDLGDVLEAAALNLGLVEVALDFPRADPELTLSPAPTLDDGEAAEVERFGADYDDDGLLGDPVPAVDPEHFAEAAVDWIQSPAPEPLVHDELVVGEPVEPTVEELRERFGFTDPVAAATGRHGGLLEDLRRAREERDEAIAAAASLRGALNAADERTDQLLRELGGARATIEAVRTFEASLAPATSPVAVFVDYNPDGTKRVRVEVSA